MRKSDASTCLWKTPWFWLAPALVWLALCFRLGYLPLLAPDEGRNAEVAREMKLSGAWLVPTYNGVDYLDKPAFFFKTVALSLRTFGDNETAARLPSAVFGLALAALTFGFCRKIYGTRCASLAAIAAGTMPIFVMNARTVIFDMTLAFFVCAAIFASYLAEETDGAARRNWYLLGAVAAGFATLVKGPVGFLLPLLVMLAFNFVERRRGAWRRILSPLNFLVFFAITLPWFVGLCLARRDFFQYGVVEESFHRFTVSTAFHRSEPFYFYLIIVATLFFPWSLLLPEAGWKILRERWTKNRADRLCVIWSVVVVVFFSISQSKLPSYVLSVAVAFGILAARLFDAAMVNREGRAERLVRRATMLFSVVCLLLFATVAVLVGGSKMQLLARPLRLPVAEVEQLRHAMLPLAIVLAAFGIAGLVGSVRRNVAICFLCFALFVPAGANAALGVTFVIYDMNSGRALAHQLSGIPAETKLACLNCFPNGAEFYLGREVTLISRDGSELTSNYVIYYLKKATRWPEEILPLAEFNHWLASQKNPVYLIVRQPDTNQLSHLAIARGATMQPLASGYWGTQLPASQE